MCIFSHIIFYKYSMASHNNIVYNDGNTVAKNDIHIKSLQQALTDLNSSRSIKGGEMRRKAADNPYLKEVAEVYKESAAIDTANQRRINKCLHNLAYKHLADIIKEKANSSDSDKRLLAKKIQQDKKILECEIRKRKN